MMRLCTLLLLLAVSVPASRGQGEDTPRENVEGRSRHRLRMRVNEKGEIPRNALLDARSAVDARRLQKGQEPRSAMDAGISGWEWLGPGNIGGRVRSIAILPNAPQTMVIGGVSGGIWRTFNGGDSWAPVNDFLANLGVTSIVVDPTTPLVMYAGTGEGFPGGTAPQGAGIFKSVDAGLTWSQLPSTVDSTWTWVTRLAHHPTQPNTLLAATSSECGYDVKSNPVLCGFRLRRSTDGGQTWSTLFTPSGRPTQVAYHPNDPRLILLGTLSELYLSTNGGITFVNQATGAAGKMPAASGNGRSRFEGAWSASGSPGTCYASIGLNNGEIWRTADSGRTWQQRNTGAGYLGAQANYDNAIWVDPTNANLVVVGGIDLWRSTDGGTTLKKISRWQDYDNGGAANSAHADQHAIVPHPGYDGATNRIVYFGNDGGVQMTFDVAAVDTNAGWVNLANDLGITQFYGGAAAPDGSIIVGGAQDNDKLHYYPGFGANNWRQATTGDGGYAAVNPANTNQLFGEYVYLGMQRSDDGGASYGGITTGLADAGNASQSLFIAPFVMDPNNPLVLVAGGATLWKTTNSGDLWAATPTQPAGAGICSALDIAPGNSNLLYAGYDNGVIARSIDGGATWAVVQAAGMPQVPVTDIAISPSLNSDVMVTFGSYETNRVWFSSNGGLTWESRNGAAPGDLPAIHVNTVRFHPLIPDWVYIGTDLGIFSSEDKGLSWSVLPLTGAGHEAPANVEVDELFWQGTTHLLAATFGRGMFRAAIQTGIWVDQANPGPGDGSFANPFQSLQAAISLQADGTPLYIKGGTFQQGGVVMSKRGRIWTPAGPVIVR